MKFNVGFKDIFEMWGWSGIVVASFILIIIYYFKSDFVKSIFSKISDWLIQKFIEKKVSEQTDKKVSESDIINHDIFNYIDFWTYSKVPILNFSTEYRTVVFRKYLTIFLKSYKKNIKDYILSKKFIQMDNPELYKSLLDLVNNIIYDYEREMGDIGIPSIIISKMKERNNNTITLILDLIDGVCNSHFYDSDNNMLKVYSILNILLSVLENTISNSNSVCNSINGQLKGSTFRDGGVDYTEPK
jgi:hypothetical protein